MDMATTTTIGKIKTNLMKTSNREEINKTDMKEITESIKAHIDMYKLTLHNVGYKNNWKTNLKIPPKNKFKKKLTNNNRSKFWPLICTSLGLTNKNIEEKNTRFWHIMMRKNK